MILSPSSNTLKQILRNVLLNERFFKKKEKMHVIATVSQLSA